MLLVLLIACFRVQSTTNLTSSNKGAFKFFGYHESNVSLIARQAMQLLVNHQLVLFPIQPEIICLEHSCYARSQAIVVTSLYCLR